MSIETTAVAAEQPIGFDYVALAEVDPNIQALETDFYTLKLFRGNLQTKQAKPGNKMGLQAGDDYQLVFATFVVTDHPENSGRRIYASPLFPGTSSLKKLRRLMDATGVSQEAGEPLDEWFKRIVDSQITFKGKVNKVKDRRDPNVDANDLDWWSLAPAD